jgi:hypothetical protein
MRRERETMAERRRIVITCDTPQCLAFFTGYLDWPVTKVRSLAQAESGWRREYRGGHYEDRCSEHSKDAEKAAMA